MKRLWFIAACLGLRLGLAPAFAAAPSSPASAPAPAPASAPGAAPATVSTAHVAVLTAEQVLQILDQTVSWYRTLGTQQQSSTQPSDLLIYYANQQTAAQVVNLAFDLARANAELLSSEASATDQNAASQSQGTAEQEAKTLSSQRDALQSELADTRSRERAASTSGKAELATKVSELQGELDMLNARLNLLDMMSTFVNQNNSRMASANALKAHIDAIAASVPGLGTDAAPATTAAAPAAPTAAPKSASAALASTTSSGNDPPRESLLGLATNVFALARKRDTIDAVDVRTATLQELFETVRSAPMERLKTMSRQSEVLARRADSAQGDELKDVRNQLDTLAWLFQQTSATLVPIIKEGVLLEQYRHNLASWHQAVQKQYGDAWRTLLIRTGILAGVLLLVFAGGEVWRRIVLRYTLELRRRQQLLLIRKLTLFVIVLLILGLTVFTELSSFATFAGLITAGVAVALQSVLTCIVGYFLLIGKYGLRVGDRVQIGAVSGEIIDLGMIRLHLMEFGSDGRLGATGRVVAFPNSIVFQATGGLFRQIPGVSLVWHEVVLPLPAGRDYVTTKGQLLSQLEGVMHDYQDAILKQSRQIEQSTASASVPPPEPQVQLRLSAGGDAQLVVRYPVQLERAVEIDDKVSQAISAILSQPAG